VLQRKPSVLLVSKPPKAKVYQAGKLLGETPLKVDASSAVVLDLTKAGYNTTRVVLDPSSPPRTIVQLQRKPTVIINSTPENATVYMNGRPVGKTPFVCMANKVTTLEVGAERHGTETITVSPDSPSRINVKLKPLPYVTVDSVPSGAKLYRLGGLQLIGTTPVSLLVENDTALELHKPGYEVKIFSLSPDAGRSVKIPLKKREEKQIKTITINSIPSGAKVYRPGGVELLGKTPLKEKVAAEKTFELQMKGYKTKIVTVAPESPDTVTFKMEKEEEKKPEIIIGEPVLNIPSSL